MLDTTSVGDIERVEEDASDPFTVVLDGRFKKEVEHQQENAVLGDLWIVMGGNRVGHIRSFTRLADKWS